MDQITTKINFVEVALGSFEDYADENQRKDYLKLELTSTKDENLKKQLKCYLRFSEPELKRARDQFQDEKLKWMGSTAGNMFRFVLFLNE
jgi:hypothetical protein